MIKKIDRKKLFLILTLIVVGVGVGLYFYMSKNIQKSNSDIEQGTVNYNSKFKSAETGNIIFPAYTENITLKKGKKTLPILLVNPLANKDIYFQYQFSLIDEKKQSICFGKTKLIKAGQAAKELTVEQKKLKNLSPKSYKCKIDVFAFKYNKKSKEKTKLNQAYWDIKLHLE
ncbi:hypothetical protein PFZ79_002838 [Enterococcus hirae]|nr:hypothetical protein [Enterococcus hirae]